MDRCAKALELHHQGYNCAQSVAGAFADLLGLPEESVMAVAGGFGGGVGGSHEETYGITKEFRRRYEEVFGLTRCGDLLRARPGVTEKNPASARLGVTAHCDNMVVTATEIVEKMLEEERAEQ